MNRCQGLLLFLLSIPFYCFGQTPVSHPDVDWALNNTFSDEFNDGVLDQDKWESNPNDWGTWSWEPDNVYITDNALTLRMAQETHVRNGQTFYFTSGITRSQTKTTYGYFEARIKASDKGQGTCPAFWMYSRGEPTPTEEGGVKYCEIDAVEIFQKPYDLQRLEMNLHTRIIENGVLTWKRPGQGDTELCANTWLAPWDPRDEYHTYGVLNRLDSIFWYVDGIQRGVKKNYYWHLPMNLTVSMGLRTPYEMYINGVRTVMPYPDSNPEPGFPTEMYCDYVRVWKTPPQLYADREKYYDSEFPINQPLEFDCRYFAGNGETVVSNTWNGLTCKLQEIDADGTVVNEFEQVVDASAVGEESGFSTFHFSLNGLVLSAALPSGHSYILRPVFRSSLNSGEDIFLEDDFYPILLVEGTNGNSPNGSVDLGSEITNNKTTGGCISTCRPTYCSDNPETNGGTHPIETMTLNITGIPSDHSAEITFTSILCGGNSGLDNNDDIFINGIKVVDGSGNASINHTECVVGGADIMIEFMANRRDEIINVSWDSGITDPGTDCFTASLPVELISFNADLLSNKNVELSWSTASEENNAYFEVEHSVDGRNFNTIEKVVGKGTTVEMQQYRFIDKSPMHGKNYYRLRQVDFNGNFEYSQVVGVDIKPADSISVYPTITNRAIKVILKEEIKKDIKFQIFDLVGRYIQSATIDSDKKEFTFSVANLNNAVYFIQFSLNGAIITKRFVKM